MKVSFGALEEEISARAASVGMTPTEYVRALVAAGMGLLGTPTGPSRVPPGPRQGPAGTVREGLAVSSSVSSLQGGGGEQVGEESPEERRSTHVKAAPLPAGFIEFWAAYPRKEGKAAALREWAKTARFRPPLATLLAVLAARKTSLDWTRENGRFIVQPQRWLKDHRWEDVVDLVAAPAPVEAERAWRVGESWADHVKAFGRFMKSANGVHPSVLPVLTSEIGGLILAALQKFDSGLLAAEDRDRWRRESITRAAGIGQFYSDWHTGKDPKANGIKQLGHDLAWRDTNTQRFADLYFEVRDANEFLEENGKNGNGSVSSQSGPPTALGTGLRRTPPRS